MENTVKRMSFFAKEPINCPACGNPTQKEEMLTGRGRLSAQELTIELRRQYHPIPQLGHITPLMYSLTTCPDCYCSLLSADFASKLSDDSISKINANKKKRIAIMNSLFKVTIDFKEPKNLIAAAASYYLALTTYPFLTKEFSPCSKNALMATRFYWLLEDLGKDLPKSKAYFDSLRTQMIPNIDKYYQVAKEKLTKGGEELPVFFGPDTDRNNAFQGFIYLSNYFRFLNRPKNNPILVEEICRRAKQELSKIFGIGKASSSRPVPILNIVRSFYDMVDEEQKKVSLDNEELL